MISKILPNVARAYGEINPNNKLNILVTGAAGYIGSHTAKYLLENGKRI